MDNTNYRRTSIPNHKEEQEANFQQLQQEGEFEQMRRSFSPRDFASRPIIYLIIIVACLGLLLTLCISYKSLAWHIFTPQYTQIRIIYANQTTKQVISDRPLGGNYPQDSEIFPHPIDLKRILQQQQNIRDANVTQESMILGRIYINLGYGDPTPEMIAYEKKYLEKRYNISQFPQEIPICVAIGSFNNAQYGRYKFNLKSVFRQEYQNYKVIYYEDASTDDTAQKVHQLVREMGIDDQHFIMIRNEKNMGPMHNHRKTAQKHCQPESIMIILDGDDGFVGTQTFKMLNAIYQSRDVWYVYTNNIVVNTATIGVSRQIPREVVEKNGYRDYVDVMIWITGHTHTFYTELFLRIPQSDLTQADGTYFPAACDRAQVHPMQQMARERFVYIPQVSYMYHDFTQNSEALRYRSDQVRIVNIMKKKAKKERLQCLFFDKQKKCIPSKDLINRMDDYEPVRK